MRRKKSSLYYRLSSIDLWNGELALYSLTLFAILSFVMDCMRLNNWSPLWLVADGAGYIAVFVPLYLFKRAFETRENRHFRTPWLNLSLAAVLGGLHNWVIAWLAIQFKIETFYEPVFRWIGGALIGIALVLVSATAFTSVQDHNERMRQLRSASKRLEKYRKSLKLLVEKESNRLRDEARKALIPQIELVQKQLAKTRESTQVAQSLKDLVVNELRPMHTALAQRASSMALMPEIKAKAGAKPQLPTAALVKHTFAPIGIFVMMVIQQSLTLYVYLGFAGIAIGAGISILALGLGYLLKSAIPARLKLKTRYAFFAVAVLSLISITPILIIDYMLLHEWESFIPGIVASSVLTITLSGFVGYVRNIQSDQRRIEGELELLNEELAEQNALFDQQLWIARRQWLTVLHGTVQASLTAAISHLNLNGVEAAERRRLATKDLKRAIKALQPAIFEPLDITAAFLDLQSTWEGICSITPIVSADAQELVLSNEQTKICVNELIKEAVSNAIRHGRATQIWINVEILRSKVIELKIENNGEPLDQNASSGLGSQLFEDLTMAWWRGYDHATKITFIRAELPVA